MGNISLSPELFHIYIVDYITISYIPYCKKYIAYNISNTARNIQLTIYQILQEIYSLQYIKYYILSIFQTAPNIFSKYIYIA